MYYKCFIIVLNYLFIFNSNYNCPVCRNRFVRITPLYLNFENEEEPAIVNNEEEEIHKLRPLKIQLKRLKIMKTLRNKTIYKV